MVLRLWCREGENVLHKLDAPRISSLHEPFSIIVRGKSTSIALQALNCRSTHVLPISGGDQITNAQEAYLIGSTTRKTKGRNDMKADT